MVASTYFKLQFLSPFIVYCVHTSYSVLHNSVPMYGLSKELAACLRLVHSYREPTELYAPSLGTAMALSALFTRRNGLCVRLDLLLEQLSNGRSRDYISVCNLSLFIWSPLNIMIYTFLKLTQRIVNCNHFT